MHVDTAHGESTPNDQIAESTSYADYETWATATLLAPDNLRYYRLKVIEEAREFLDASDAENMVEEAGDLLWTLSTARALTSKLLYDQSLSPSIFEPASIASIAEAWTFDMDRGELRQWIQDSVFLYQRKTKLAVWIYDSASEDVKNAYVSEVIDLLLPQLIAAITQLTNAETGRGINDILATNIQKLEQRIATNALAKTARIKTLTQN